AKVARDLELEVRTELFSSFINTSWSFIQSQELGKIPNLLLRETEKYSTAIQQLGKFLSACLIAGILVISSVFASWQLALLFVSAVLPYFLLTRLINKRVSTHAKKRIVEANSMSAQISENIMHLKYVKASALEDLIASKFSQNVKKYASHCFKIACYMRFIKNFPEIFGVLIIAALIIYSHSYMGLKTADIIFFLLLMFRGYRQISGVQTILSSMIENIPSYEICQNMIQQSLNNKEKISGKKENLINKIKISLKGLVFSYDRASTPTLKNINLNLPENGLIAFVGLSGAGKTTLADLVLGLISPQEGSITIDGKQSLHDMNLQDWRQKIGYVPQEPFLISGTIGENILLHAQDKTDAHLHKIAKLAKLDQFIEDLPEKYDTHLNLVNTGISGGQKQRIALARALAHKPSLLILDEATSALDAQTAKDIRETIKDISNSIPVLMIAHSLDMIKQADIIHVMENGQIIESGQYDKLTKNKKGAFYALQNTL
ncbi:MAG: ABC transporter ATP-binding protein/permease, partial [Alphaproteobacteria bacterium]|nr:ABC transporter ATP-binding protein/permease [Alphaproteobacteria bacterium]